MNTIVKCETCLYNKNCQFLGVHKNAVVEGCTAYKNAADVAEVIHGRWEQGYYEGGIFDGTNFEKCNVCQFERLFHDIRFKTTFNYCPNCGAKMDGATDTNVGVKKKEGAENG